MYANALNVKCDCFSFSIVLNDMGHSNIIYSLKTQIRLSIHTVSSGHSTGSKDPELFVQMVKSLLYLGQSHVFVSTLLCSTLI